MRAVGGAAAAPSYPAVVVVAAVEVAVFVDVGDIDEHPRHSTATAASNASRRTIEPYSSSRSLIRGEGHRTGQPRRYVVVAVDVPDRESVVKRSHVPEHFTRHRRTT
jgi:hypothetical protein